MNPQPASPRPPRRGLLVALVLIFALGFVAPALVRGTGTAPRASYTRLQADIAAHRIAGGRGLTLPEPPR